MQHTGSWDSHDDDCQCGLGSRHCNRGSACWSCCGACKQDSECTGTRLHPTHWSHPKHGQTVAGYSGGWPTYKSNEEIRRIAPECF